MKILICDKLDTLAVENLQELGDCIDVSNEKNKEALIEENIVDADILLVRSGTNITKELIDKANSLKLLHAVESELIILKYLKLQKKIFL